MKTLEIYVVAWSWSDQSGWGVIRAFAHKADADELRDILEEHGDRKFVVLPVPGVGLCQEPVL